jgi:hypothetical protein
MPDIAASMMLVVKGGSKSPAAGVASTIDLARPERPMMMTRCPAEVSFWTSISRLWGAVSSIVVSANIKRTRDPSGRTRALVSARSSLVEDIEWMVSK